MQLECTHLTNFQISTKRQNILDSELVKLRSIIFSIILSSFAIESCPTHCDIRGRISPFCSLSGVPSHDVYTWLDLLWLLVCLAIINYCTLRKKGKRSCFRSSSPFLSTDSPNNSSFFFPCSCQRSSSHIFSLYMSLLHTVGPTNWNNITFTSFPFVTGG